MQMRLDAGAGELRLDARPVMCGDVGIADPERPPAARPWCDMPSDLGKRTGLHQNVIAALAQRDIQPCHRASPSNIAVTVRWCGPSLLRTWICASAYMGLRCSARRVSTSAGVTVDGAREGGGGACRIRD